MTFWQGIKGIALYVWETWRERRYQLTWENVDNVYIGGVDRGDYPDFCDSFIESAEWKHNGRPLTDDELDELQNKYPDSVWELAHETAIEGGC